MTSETPQSGKRPRSEDAGSDTEAALQRELARERTEGRTLIGDVTANRNLSGSSTWETLPAPGRSTRRHDARRSTPRSDLPTADGRDDLARRAQEEIADRLHRLGVTLTGRESGEELADVLEAVEGFEAAVERAGGDLMVDEPVGDEPPIAPDDVAFVLPRRRDGESIRSLLERIARATSRATARGARD